MANSSRRAELDPDDPIVITPQDFEKLREFTRQRFGLDFRDGKETLITVRLRRKMREANARSFSEYFRQVLDDSTGVQLIAMVDALTTNYTHFFREPAHFQFLSEVVMPAIGARRRISIWSAGCATGQEPYSIVFHVARELGMREAMGRLEVLATDISARALQTAEMGIYNHEQTEALSPECLKAFWLRGENRWQGCLRVRAEVRSMVRFERLNLMETFPRDRRFHVIFCRNVMIYFNRETQEQIVKKFAYCLEPGGYLFIGHAESLSGLDQPLKPVAPAIYRSAEG
ncbi:MAG TPA: protein-glutamate O-methyltransferase CheR [Bryobacteraceae bacterium]|nr:protein-glutamate O-methyltransferase CheR [Bryobacteraceae bacterium]